MVKPFNLNGLKTYDLQSRPSKVFVEDLGRPLPPGATIADWLDSLPDQLAGKDLRRVCDHLKRCVRDGRGIVAALGGHVIKTGCGPYLVDWVEQGILHGVALNGAAAIHDVELALAGKTSEDVGASLASGQFGMAARPPTRSPWPPTPGRSTNVASAGRLVSTSTGSIARTVSAASSSRRIGPEFLARSMLRWGRTSSICILMSLVHRWAKRR